MWYSAMGYLVTLALTILLTPLAADGQAAATVPPLHMSSSHSGKGWIDTMLVR